MAPRLVALATLACWVVTTTAALELTTDNFEPLVLSSPEKNAFVLCAPQCCDRCPQLPVCN